MRLLVYENSIDLKTFPLDVNLFVDGLGWVNCLVSFLGLTIHGCVVFMQIPLRTLVQMLSLDQI